VCTTAAFQGPLKCLCAREKNRRKDLNAHYVAKLDRKPFVFIMWSFLLILAELPLFYGMHSFTSQPFFSVTKISRPDRYFDLKINHEVHLSSRYLGKIIKEPTTYLCPSWPLEDPDSVFVLLLDWFTL